jgi:hypothetical protein
LKEQPDREEARTSPSPLSRLDRLHWILAALVCGLLALVVVLRIERNPSARLRVLPAASDAPPPLQTPAIGGATPDATAPAIPRPPPAAPNASSRLPGRILGRVILPQTVRNKAVFSYQVYVFDAEGRMEGPRAFANSDRFELAGQSSGRKAIFFFSPAELMTCPCQVATVPEGGDCEVVLQPKACHMLEGRVVDANGMAIGGVYVTATETIPLPQDLYLEGKPAAIAGLETAVSVTGATAPTGAERSDVPIWTLKVEPGEGRVSRGVITDPRGKFSLPLSSLEVPVPLSVSRGPAQLLKEEVVIPSAGPARIIVPNQ